MDPPQTVPHSRALQIVEVFTPPPPWARTACLREGGGTWYWIHGKPPLDPATKDVWSVPGTGYTGNLLLTQQPKMCGRGETAHLLQCIISLDIWPKKPTHVARWWQKGKLVGLVAGSSFCMWMNKQRVGFSHEGVEPLLGGEKCCLGSQNLSVLNPSSASSNLLPTSSKLSSESLQSRSLHGEQLCFCFNCLTTFA